MNVSLIPELEHYIRAEIVIHHRNDVGTVSQAAQHMISGIIHRYVEMDLVSKSEYLI
jgi:hypothetical protein